MKAELVSVTPIWEGATHNAFTALVFFAGRFYCAFREGEEHACHHGKIRVLASDDARKWVSVACMRSPHEALQDLRDPKLCLLPDGRLMLLAGATARTRTVPQRNYIWFSSDGTNWGAPKELGGEGKWLWSVAVEEGDAYFTAYAPMSESEGVTLYRSRELPGVESIATLCDGACFPNETAISMSQGQAVAVIRRELAIGQTSMPPFNNGTALLATAVSPYTEWETTDIGFYIGGPVILNLPDKRRLIAGREIVGGVHRCALWILNEDQRELLHLTTLPSGGDCSYPGLVWHRERLFVSYYSSHEGSSKIYLAEVLLPFVGEEDPIAYSAESIGV